MVMKTPLRLFRIGSLIAAVSFATIAVAQPPPGIPGDPGGPVPRGPRGPGRPPIVIPIPVPPRPPSAHYRHNYTGESTVAQVQRAVKKLGYYAGPVDGDAGRGTRSAIASFRYDNGLGSSTRIDSGLMRALGL
jgi:hypothetical protein